MTENKTLFEELSAINCNSHTENKPNGSTELTYLSWTWAWDYFKRHCPDATYEIKHWDGKPYMYDEKTGYLVETSVTANGETLTMWLAVMDPTNHAMMTKPYQVQTKYKTITVPAATMTDINKNIMRCLVKNIAMFGLGLYIYAGEDLPDIERLDEVITEEVKEQEPIVPVEKITEAQKKLMIDLEVDMVKLAEFYKVESVDDLTSEQAGQAIKAKLRKREKADA